MPTVVLPRLAPLLLALVLLASGIATPALARQATPAAGIDRADATPAHLDAAALAEFDAYVAGLLAELGVPGASVAVVQGGETVFARGYGVREAGGTSPVTADTLMMVGSNTKSMTAVMAATLVDGGFVTWDTPVAALLPGFRLSDPVLAERITLADAFCACTGLPRRDVELIANFNDLDPESLVASLERIPITAPFGERFQYSNQLFAVGGYAAARAAGAPPDDLLAGYRLAMRQRLLDPLGMARSTFAVDEVLSTGDYALPHAATLDGETAPVRLLADEAFVTAVAPAGALWSTAREMADYVRMQLADGVAPSGQWVVSEDNLARTRQPRVEVEPGEGETPPLLASATTGYAMGWATGTWHGQPLLSHSGGTLGFVSEVAFLPEADLGVVILTNGGALAGPFAYAVQFRLFELAFGLEPEFGPLLTELIEQGAAQLAAALADIGPVDPAAVAPFVGRYANPDLGEVELRLEEGRFVLDVGELASELLVLGDGDVYLFADPPLAGAPITIALSEREAGERELVLTSFEDEEPVTSVLAPVDAAATPPP